MKMPFISERYYPADFRNLKKSDYKEVATNHWIRTKEGQYICSYCFIKTKDFMQHEYCEHCGRKMIYKVKI